MTLIELMMSLVVLSIGIMGVAMLFPFGSRGTNDGRLLTQAADLAQQKMEQLRTLSYSHADLAVGTHPSASGETVGDTNRFQRWWTVTQLGTGQMESRRVEVAVTWTATRPDTARLTTIFKR